MGVSITAAPCLDALRTLLLKLKGSASSSWDTNNSDLCTWRGVNCTSTKEDIQELHLSGFHLNGVIPAEIDTLQALSALDLSNNSLNGSIPPELGNCSSLLSVNLASNMLGGILPASLGKLPKLQVLDLSQNEITESIPAEFGNLTSLQELNLESNQLTGTIEVILRLTALTDLSLSRNNFTGSLPAGISTLFPNLKNFSAYQNKLDGTIPSMVMSTLQSVNLASNSLTGIIPANMCTSKKLLVLTLDNNRLFGTIPEDLGTCNSLTTLRLGGNNFTGSIPNSIGNLQNLVYFVADDNRLNGTIPSNISGWKSLSLLNLASNQLSGSIPSQLGEAVNLQELLLSNNKFTGAIPQELVKCKNLSKLHLSGNLLNGSLPSDICSLLSLEYLQLDGNALDGSLPPSIGKCERLLDLQLGHNKFNGSIPTEIGDLVNLIISLNLSSNEFTGTIPASLGKLTKLVLLDLSHNHLTGPIPKELGSMFSLLNWSFADNSLSGAVPMTGPLANSTASSFANNPNLCGGPLRPCEGSLSSSREKRNSHTFWKAAGIAIACALVVLLIISGIVIGVMHKHYFGAAVDPTPAVAVRRLFSDDIEQAIDFDSMKEATNSNANIISTSHFSTIYKAVMPSGLVLAVKKLNSTEKGVLIYQRRMILELDKIWKFSHENIMQPVGYFLENDFAVIVYDFVPAYSLSQKLHRNFESLLPWSTRYKIAIAAAQGLSFLHHSCNPPMMHMDVSSNNIFLGPNLEVKVGDVEVAKLLDPTKHTGSISAVAGSFGYIAPEYAFTMRVTLASNVYSFGVVLLELLTGRRPVDESFGDGLDLVRWVHGASSRGEMPEQILDARISTQSFASRQEMLAVLKVAVSCTNASPLKRPRMKKVLEGLQEAKVSPEALSPVSS
ncbi:hypothetical protein GOP47_0015896 [Adiantum capillus-veneris]|uniref:non-specific serine/threonine protein kinase n=1 Tax=Adiantum capillus-veneris TaxID=13818 RepID=A0A9D4ZDM8_ADICA|nr:hypothetical protein GOP47_0015896 [Adiantum capillus-veneris]